MKPGISIIIPVYNAAQYLTRCLDSIIGQSYHNWECTLIDDGSADDSGRICDEFVKKDPRFRVIHNDNGGVSVARNIGIEESTGEWLFFCDADDEVLPDGLQTLIDVSSGSGCEMVFGGYVVCNEEGEMIASPREEVCKEFSKIETIEQLYRASYSNYEGYLWCKLFRTDLIKNHHLSFSEEIFFNEDRLFIMQCLAQVCHAVVYTSTPVYRYYHHPQSVYWSLQKQWNPRYVTDLRAYVKMYETVSEITSRGNVLLIAKEGIRSSIKTIRRMLKRNHVKDVQVESEVAQIEKMYLGIWDKIRLYFLRRSRKLKHPFMLACSLALYVWSTNSF